MPAPASRRISPLAIIVVLLLAGLVAYAVVLKSGRFHDTRASTLHGADAPPPPQASHVADRQQPSTGPEAMEQHNSANEVGGTEDTGNKASR